MSNEHKVVGIVGWVKVTKKPKKEGTFKWSIPAGGYGTGDLLKYQAQDFFKTCNEFYELDETPITNTGWTDGDMKEFIEEFRKCKSFAAGKDKEKPMVPMFWFHFGCMMGLLHRMDHPEYPKPPSLTNRC